MEIKYNKDNMYATTALMKSKTSTKNEKCNEIENMHYEITGTWKMEL